LFGGFNHLSTPSIFGKSLILLGSSGFSPVRISVEPRFPCGCADDGDNSRISRNPPPLKQQFLLSDLPFKEDGGTDPEGAHDRLAG
jgi:hypothetical protein